MKPLHLKNHLHLIEEDLLRGPGGWFHLAVDRLEDEIGRSFRNHCAFDRWLEANEPSFEPDLELEWEVGPDVEILFTPSPKPTESDE